MKQSHRSLALFICSVGLVFGPCSPARADREAFELLTRNPANGVLADSLYNSDNPAITADGRYVVFESSQTGLVSPATNGQVQIFLYDRKLNQMELISVAAAGGSGNGPSNHPAISADGCKVVFESTASNLTAGDSNGLKDAFLRNRCATPAQTQLISLGAAGEQSTAAGSGEVDISGDGNYAAFYFGGSGTNGREGVYLRDLRAGTSQCISISQLTTHCESARHPALSADGARVAFWSFGPLLQADVNTVWDIYLYDRNASALSLVSVSASGQQRTQGNESSSRIVLPAISGDGRYVAFATTSGALVANDTNGFQDVFVKDTVSGNVTMASVSSAGAAGNGNSPIGQGERPSLSSDGKWVVFTTSATNLTPARGAGTSNMVAHNMVTGATIDFFAPPRFGVGSQAVVSPDALGRYVVVFATDALDARFAKGGIFVHDRITQCLLNWAEVVVPNLFTPPTGATQLLPPYTYRAYATAYLGISVTDDHAYTLVPSVSPAPVDQGPLTAYLDNSGCR
jgi:Tol biopolymer transport system component